MLINTNYIYTVRIEDDVIKVTLPDSVECTLSDIDKSVLQDVYDEVTHDVKTKQWVDLRDYEELELPKEKSKFI